MGAQQLAINSLLATYRWTRNVGLLDNPFMERTFIRSYFLYKRYIEDSLAPLLKNYPDLIGEGDVLDIGANVGYTALLFAKFLKKNSRVFAFEPDQKNFNALQKAIHLAKEGRKITPLKVAIGDYCGTVDFLLNHDHHADHKVLTRELRGSVGKDSPIVSVPLISIDSFLASQKAESKITFIKIDVQGFEPGVCRGMVDTIARNPQAPVVFEHSPASSRQMGFYENEVPEFFRTKGYQLFEITRGGRLKSFTIEREVVSNSGKKEYCDLLAVKDRELHPL